MVGKTSHCTDVVLSSTQSRSKKGELRDKHNLAWAGTTPPKNPRAVRPATPRSGSRLGGRFSSPNHASQTDGGIGWPRVDRGAARGIASNRAAGVKTAPRRSPTLARFRPPLSTVDTPHRLFADPAGEQFPGKLPRLVALRRRHMREEHFAIFIHLRIR